MPKAFLVVGRVSCTSAKHLHLLLCPLELSFPTVPLNNSIHPIASITIRKVRNALRSCLDPLRPHCVGSRPRRQPDRPARVQAERRKTLVGHSTLVSADTTRKGRGTSLLSVSTIL